MIEQDAMDATSASAPDGGGGGGSDCDRAAAVAWPPPGRELPALLARPAGQAEHVGEAPRHAGRQVHRHLPEAQEGEGRAAARAAAGAPRTTLEEVGLGGVAAPHRRGGGQGQEAAGRDRQAGVPDA